MSNVPKILIATQIVSLDEQLANNKELIDAGYEPVIPGYGDLIETAIKIKDELDKTAPPVAVISRALASSMEAVIDAVYQLRAGGYRVVLLPGIRGGEEPEYLVKEAFRLGVYDFVYDPVTAEKVVRQILNPATLAEAGVEPDGEAVGKPAAGKRKAGFLGKLFIFRKKKETQSGTVFNEGRPGREPQELVPAEEAILPVRKTPAPERPATGPPETPATVLLVGARASALAPEMAALGWKTVNDPSFPSGVAVVDIERVPEISRQLCCPLIGLGSGRLSEWFSVSDEGVLVASDRASVIALVSECLNAARPGPESKKAGQNGYEMPKACTTSPVLPQSRGFVFAFYSGAQGFQGKTVLAINTAALLAGQGRSVCIVDLDTDKAGLTMLCGYSDDRPPAADLARCFGGEITFVDGPAGVKLIPAPLKSPGWFPDPQRVGEFVARLASEHDYVVLDFGAKIASPAVIAALKASDRVFLVSTPLRTALSAVARFRGRELSEVGGEKVTAVINRVGVRGGISPRDAARLLGFDDQYVEIPEDPAVASAESDAAKNGEYCPPALKKKGLFKKKSLLGLALLKLLGETEARA